MPSPNDIHVIFPGQSNTIIPGNTGPAPYVPTPRVQIWIDTDGDRLGDQWHYMNPGVNTGTPGAPSSWGPEVAFANEWLAANPDGFLWIVKTARGETSLAENPNGLDWATSSENELFDWATAEINNARQSLAGTPYEFDQWEAAFWMQGETDAYVYEWAVSYWSNYAELIDSAREEWAVEKWGTSQIHDVSVNWSWVRYGQAIAPHDGMVDTIEYSRQADGIHLDASGSVSLGSSLYSLFDSWY